MPSFQYREAAGARPDAPILFLFHGTGGDENQFFELGAQLLPGARRIAVRGDVSEHGAARYFKRTGEGVYDMADLALRTEAMAGFIAERIAEGSPSAVAGFGYSNGANILASVMFAHPELVGSAALLHPLIPFAPPPAPGLVDKRVLITAGQRDPMAPPAMTEALAKYFERQGAAAGIAWHAGGHEVRGEELVAAQNFLRPLAIQTA